MCSYAFIMANQIQHLPVIEWQPERAPVARTYTANQSSANTDFGFIVSMIAVAAVCISGLTIAAATSVNTELPPTYIHRSN